MKDEILKKVHDIRGSLNVVLGFIQSLDVSQLSEGQWELCEACRLSLDKIEKNLDAM